MKNTQKKLKAKHFRYLNNENIQNPRKFLSYFFERIALHHWQEKIYVFLSSGSTQQRYPIQDPTFIHQNLIKQIEYAFVLYHQHELTPIGQRLIAYFFEATSKENWLEQLDEILRNETDQYYDHDTDSYNLYFVKFIELSHYLVTYLYLYTQNKEDEFQFPYYILPVHKLEKEELERANYHEHIGTFHQSNNRHNFSFFHNEKIELPEWLRPQAYSTEAVQSFFRIDSLSGWKEALWNWYQSVITKDVYWSASNTAIHLSGANLLYNYACFSSIIQMYHQLNAQPIKARHQKFNTQHKSIFKEQLPLKFHHNEREHILNHVTLEDVSTALDNILSCINEYSQGEWFEILYDWLSCGLSKNAISDENYASHTARIYQLLSRIIELSYLIAFKDEIEFIEVQPLNP